MKTVPWPKIHWSVWIPGVQIVTMTIHEIKVRKLIEDLNHDIVKLERDEKGAVVVK